jgi:hypothetical protein
MPKVGQSQQNLFRIFPSPSPDAALQEIRTGGGLFMVVHLPWGMIAPHEERAKKNHGGMSLKQLNGRGGLRASDVVAILEDRDEAEMPISQANMRLVELWIEYAAA